MQISRFDCVYVYVYVCIYVCVHTQINIYVGDNLSVLRTP